MRLRTRLVIIFSILLVVVVGVVGALVVGSTRSVLVGAIDEELEEIRTGIREKFLNSADLLDQVTIEVDPDRPAVKSPQALVIVDVETRAITSQASGFTDDPDPLPSIETFAEIVATGEFATIDSEDGSLHYRAFAWATDTGEIGVWAVPLREVDASVNTIIQSFVITAIVVALLGGVGIWIAVRRELRPVDQMVDTADAIAGGDLTRRVESVESSVELGRLGSALNEMLGRIENAVKQEQNANARLTDFVADASHELRTPIAAILGYSQLYRQGALTEQEAIDNAMRRIGTESARMERLVEDLLMLARLDQTKGLEFSWLNLPNLVQDAVTDSLAIDPDHPVIVEGEAEVVVEGDEQRLMQIVVNLLANARQHTPKGTEITVRIGSDEKYAILDVIDDGPGFAEDAADRIFERFYRHDSSRSRETGGAGLGLAIVSAITNAHDGEIEAANEPGRGARITVRLPLKADVG